MSSPLTPGVPVGYVVAEDVYIAYSEYYGDGTIYGRRALTTPEGEAVRGVGKSVADLVAAGVLVSDEAAGALNGDLLRVEYDVGVQIPEPAAPVDEAPAPEAPAPEAVPEEAPAPEAPAVEVSLKKVIVKFKGVTITCNTTVAKDITVNVDDAAGSVEFSL